MDSFIQKVNTIYEKLDAIEASNENFNEEVINVLLELKDLQLGLVASDLDKGTFKGNRKTDINLALNMVGITKELIKDNPDSAELIWTDNTKTVFYDKATVLFKDGVVIEIPFVFDGSPTTISTHSDLLLQLNNSDAFKTKLENTLMAAFPALVVGEFVRFYDVTGQSSNLERITLNAVSGAYIEQNPDYYWAKTTSATETLSMRGGDIDKIGNEIDNILALVNRIEEVLEIQEDLPKLIDTYDENGNPNGDLTIYNKLTELIEIHAQLTALVTIYNDIKTGGDNCINSVGADLQLGVDSEIKKVNANKTNIDAVNANKDNIDTNAENADAINTVATDLDLGASSKIKINADNIDEILAVALNLAKIIAVNNNETNINKNANNEDNINTVAVNILDVIANAENMTDIKNALNYANTASQKAEDAANARDAILNLNVSAQTLASNQLATVAFDSLSGLLSFGIPQGAKGDKGDPYEPDARGLYANRTLYDNELKDFAYLAYDVEINGEIVPQLYFKNSNNPADWSVGSSFGRGATGTGIESNLFTSTTDASGIEGVAGATDTYTITYTDGSTSTWIKKNGIVPTKADLGLENVNNTSDLNKPISNATQTALNLKANTTDVNTALNTKLNKSAVLPVLTSTDDASALSASQGKILKDLIDNINTVLMSDDTTLDEIQELVNFIKQNRTDLDALGISNIAGLVDALAVKANSTDVNTALAGKQATLVSGVNVKTLNGNSLLGSGNILIDTSSYETLLYSGSYSGISSLTFNSGLSTYDEINMMISFDTTDSDSNLYLQINNLTSGDYRYAGNTVSGQYSQTRWSIPRNSQRGTLFIKILKNGTFTYRFEPRYTTYNSTASFYVGGGDNTTYPTSISAVYMYDIGTSATGLYSVTGVKYA